MSFACNAPPTKAAGDQLTEHACFPHPIWKHGRTAGPCGMSALLFPGLLEHANSKTAYLHGQQEDQYVPLVKHTYNT